MQGNINQERIARGAGRFTQSDALRVLRRRECKARQLARGARRALKAAALAAMLATGAAHGAELAPRAPVTIESAAFLASAGSKQAFCGAMWKAEKPRLAADGTTWRDYWSACARALRPMKRAPAEPRACTTDSDCERMTGRPFTMAPRVAD